MFGLEIGQIIGMATFLALAIGFLAAAAVLIIGQRGICYLSANFILMGLILLAAVATSALQITIPLPK